MIFWSVCWWVPRPVGCTPSWPSSPSPRSGQGSGSPSYFSRDICYAKYYGGRKGGRGGGRMEDGRWEKCSYPFYIVTCYIKWVTTTWTYSTPVFSLAGDQGMGRENQNRFIIKKFWRNIQTRINIINSCTKSLEVRKIFSLKRMV